MLANVRFDHHRCDTERRQQYKSRADDVLLSRSYTNQAPNGIRCDSPTSDKSIFDMLSTYSAR